MEISRRFKIGRNDENVLTIEEIYIISVRWQSSSSFPTDRWRWVVDFQEKAGARPDRFRNLN